MEFVSYDTAKLAKEKGYNESSRVYYDITGALYTQSYENFGYIPNFSCYAPLQDELRSWLRDNRGIHISIILVNKDSCRYYAFIIYTPCSEIKSDTELIEELFMCYENALEEALKIALNLLQ